MSTTPPITANVNTSDAGAGFTTSFIALSIYKSDSNPVLIIIGAGIAVTVLVVVVIIFVKKKKPPDTFFNLFRQNE